MSLKELYDLLGTTHIPGTPEQLDILRRRIEELVDLNGEAWIRDNRRRLLVEWEWTRCYLNSAES